MSNKPETARQPAKPTDLLPCPFCGKPPTTERITSTAGDSWVWSIQCDGCDVYCSTAAWNTRAGDPAQQAPSRDKIAETLYELQPIEDRLGGDGAPIAWRELAGFCKGVHYEQADAILALCGSPQPPNLLNSRATGAQPMRKALEAAAGYLTNARIDLTTGAPKATALRTIDGGLKLIKEALDASPQKENAPAISEDDLEMLNHLASGMGFGRTYEMLRRVIAAIRFQEVGEQK